MQSDSLFKSLDRSAMKNLLFEKVREYSVFEIANTNKKSKNYGRKIYIASSYMTEENILSRLRSIKNSKTGRGGTKDVAADIKAAGENYDENFKVTTVASNLSRERAEEIKSSQIEKHNKVYNQIEYV